MKKISRRRSHNKVKTIKRRMVSYHVRKLIARYTVSIVSITQIKPSPENTELYGPITEETDAGLSTLIASIKRIGLEEPLILTLDGFILSGHRRFVALQALGETLIPVRYANVRRSDAMDYHRLLAQYNPQRVKSVAAMLSEKLLNSDDQDSERSWVAYQERRIEIKVPVVSVSGFKSSDDVGPRQQEFLLAVQKVIENMRDYWSLSVRQVHYRLLNDPPLTQTTSQRNERWRYRNDLASYKKLSSLLVAARYAGYVPWEAIDDTTRDSRTYFGYKNVNEFISSEVSNFLNPRRYGRIRQEGQPHHIEVVIEKNTLINVVEDICQKFRVPFTPLRGYGGPSVWHEIEERWREKVRNHTGPVPPKCILILISDHDPEGLDLADDAVRSLRDKHGVEIEAIRPAVTMEQVKQYNLHPNPAKETSSRFQAYVKRTGTTQCWECEALDPDVLRTLLHDAIVSVLSVDQLNAVQELEAEEKNQLVAMKRRLGTTIQGMVAEGGL
jgi:ParB-like nuclease domain